MPTHTSKVDNKLPESFLTGAKLLEQSRQEEWAAHASPNLFLDEEREGQSRLCLRKKKLRARQINAGVEAEMSALFWKKQEGGMGAVPICRPAPKSGHWRTC